MKASTKKTATGVVIAMLITLMTVAIDKMFNITDRIAGAIRMRTATGTATA